MIGKSDVMHALRERIKAASRISSSVLVTGESGTGKELVAKAIHEYSERRSCKFVAVDCGALPDELIESELFGHKRGAFTTAIADKPGLFEEANGGTLFLDEIANTSRRFQAKLLRVLQDRQLRRLGDVTTRKLDLRVIAATNRELMPMVRRGDFREDLFYRLNVFPIEVPPLRRRIEDVPLLVEHMLREREKKLDEVIVSDFWESVARPYTERLITKNQVEHLIRQGLERTGGSYKKMLPLFRIADSDYKRFMDFLRRHNCNIDFRGYRRK